VTGTLPFSMDHFDPVTPPGKIRIGNTLSFYFAVHRQFSPVSNLLTVVLCEVSFCKCEECLVVFKMFEPPPNRVMVMVRVRMPPHYL